MHEFDFLVSLFITRVRGMRMVVTPDIVSNVLSVPRVEYLDYPGCDRLKTMFKDKFISSFCERLLIGVSVSSLIVRALLKALVFLTWS